MDQHQTGADRSAEAEVAARELLDVTWAVIADSPLVARELGRTLERLPDIGFDAIARRARAGAEIVARIDRVDASVLDPERALDLSAARARALTWVRSEEWYWLAFDPLGDGFFSMFAPSAYSGVFVLNIVHEALATASIEGAGGVPRHLELIGDYARLVGQITERTEGQAERGIRMPRPQLERALPLLTGIRELALQNLHAVSERSAAALSTDQLSRIGQRIAADVEPAFDRLFDLLGSADYAASAPQAVGLGNYPGGRAIYEELVAIHTTQPLSAAAVHERGHARMARIEDDMAALLTSVGFEGTPAAYLEAIGDDESWRSRTDEEIEARFQNCIDRFAPEVGAHFGVAPEAGYGTAALPSAVSGSMTFGYYSPPQADRDSGVYFFNGANLTQTPLPMIAALNYHELVPGHHLHIALQQQRTDLHPLRQHSASTAFTEGWAEYAARFAGEVGMYHEPEERFGRLMMEAFLTSRLVVDTGMNAFGWDLERARAYMQEHAFLGDAEIDSETLRYSCDIPGQALAYTLGDDFLLELREDVRRGLGERFVVSDFHDAVLNVAGLPLPLVAQHVWSALR